MQFQNNRESYFSNRFVAASILIPDMNFTCDSTIVTVTVGGVLQTGKNQSIKLCTWKKNASMPRIYHKSQEIIDLAPDICDYKNNRRYSCSMGGNQISVKSGDILGIELPPSEDADFELNSLLAPPLMNYIFEGTNLSSTVDLCNMSKIITVQPLIMLEISQGDSGTIIIMRAIMRRYVLIEYHIIADDPITRPTSYDQSTSCPTPESTLTSMSPSAASFDSKGKFTLF